MPGNTFKDKNIASKAGSKSKPGKHKKTQQWEALAESIITTHAERFNKVLSDLDDADFAKIYKDILNYFKPKISYNINSETKELPDSVTFKVKK